MLSGGAYGIDGAAHRGALASRRAPTAAVLACGVDVAYPRGHDRLLALVAERGLLVSEQLPGAAPTRARFLVRNRLIAALSRRHRRRRGGAALGVAVDRRARPRPAAPRHGGARAR